MKQRFSPWYPQPHAEDSSFLMRLRRGWSSTLEIFSERNYSMRMVRFRQGGQEIFVIADPATARRVLVDMADVFPKNAVLHELLEDLTGSSLFTTNGDLWRRQRHLVDQGLMNARVRDLFPLMQAAVTDMLGRLTPQAGRVMDIDAEMTHVTADIIFRTIFSKPLDATESQFLYTQMQAFQMDMQKKFMLRIYRLPTLLLGRKAQRAADRIRKVIIDLVDARLAALAAGQPAPADMLTTLIGAKDQAGLPYAREEIIDQICLLFLAGHETSAASLAWTLHMVAHDPAVQARMRAEIQEKCPEGLTADNIRRLSFVADVFREGLRLFPPVAMFPREAAADAELRGRQVPKGHMCCWCLG